jgi:hypothetical protein
MSPNRSTMFRSSFMPELRLGIIGVILMTVLSFLACVLGVFAFYGLAFLVHWPLLADGGLAAFVCLSALWGTIVECCVWIRRGSGAIGWTRAAQPWFAAFLIVFLGMWWLALNEYRCDLIMPGGPVLPLVGVATVYCQVPIIRPFQDAQRYGTAFAVLLILEAIMMFELAEGMSADHFRKGLENFRKDPSITSYINLSGNSDFIADYGRKEFVLTAHSSTGSTPFQLRRRFCE